MDVIHFQGCACGICSAPPDPEEVLGTGSAPSDPTESAPSGKTVYDDSQVINALRTFDGASSSWAWAQDTVTYSISSGQLVSGQSGYRSEHSGYVEMTAAMQAAATEAFELWDDLIAIDLVASDNDQNAGILFNYSSNTSGNGTYASTSYNYTYTDRADWAVHQSQIWASNNWWTHDQDSDLYQGGYGIMTYLHEVGHALGLSHPGNYNGTGDFAADATYHQDTRGYTIQSYFNAAENGSGADHYAASGGLRYGATPLLHDILAIQSIYGADMTTRTGNTVYGFNSTAGRDAFDFSINTDPVVAIWDAGGIDTLDLSGFSNNQVITLVAGEFSDVGRQTQNLAIAHNAVVEIAIGGSGNDHITGNTADNVLDGGAGHDSLFGGDGADVLWGGAGMDTLDGGGGTDWVRYANSSAGVTVDLSLGLGADGDAQGDSFTGIENASGSACGDTLTGDGSTANQLFGLDGDDIIIGNGGHDFLLGHGGDDSIYGGTGRDVIRGGAGADHIDGGSEDDWVQFHDSGAGVALDLSAGTGSGGDAAGDTYVSIEHVRGTDYADTITGSSDRNMIYGQDGDDVIASDGGNDLIYGQDGDDTITGGSAGETFHGGAGADTIDGAGGLDWVRYSDAGSGVSVSLLTGSGTLGDAAGDQLSNVEHLWGSEYDDVLEGDDGVNMIRGGAGDDTITGHQGNDIMQGYDGADLFVFDQDDGIDRINGFEIGTDSIRIIGPVTSFGDLSVSTFKGDAAIAYDQGDVIILTGIAAGSVTSSMFTFG